MAIKLSFIFALVCLSFDCVCCSSSSGAGPATQTCPNGYYCPTTNGCLTPRSARCTTSQNCPALDQSCNKQSGNSYLIQIGHAELGLSGSKKTLFEHRFVIYRGFAYEFGGSYNTQVLDISDPQYKYVGGRHLNSNGIESAGTSRCTYADAQMFVTGWTKKYNVFTNNCQNFVKAMTKYLKTNCNRSISKQNTNSTASLQDEIEEILSDCSVVCCSETSTSSAAAALSVRFAGLVFTSIIIILSTNIV
uniref:LRAT domain-containing protein n=1 Tax=Amphimedon queenslandica TaxID=400682 RepID=A0A1X7TP39_AMPQE